MNKIKKYVPPKKFGNLMDKSYLEILQQFEPQIQKELSIRGIDNKEICIEVEPAFLDYSNPKNGPPLIARSEKGCVLFDCYIGILSGQTSKRIGKCGFFLVKKGETLERNWKNPEFYTFNLSEKLDTSIWEGYLPHQLVWFAMDKKIYDLNETEPDDSDFEDDEADLYDDDESEIDEEFGFAVDILGEDWPDADLKIIFKDSPDGDTVKTAEDTISRTVNNWNKVHGEAGEGFIHDVMKLDGESKGNVLCYHVDFGDASEESLIELLKAFSNTGMSIEKVQIL